MHLTDVTFRYRRRSRPILDRVTAGLAPGDVVELTGSNGAGKSTLLRLLAGLTRPSSGTVTARPAVVGYAPDRLPTAQPFTVAQYLTHHQRIRGCASWRPWAACGSCPRCGTGCFPTARSLSSTAGPTASPATPSSK
ncbi:ABC transporter ATP-binding protein [Nonomuraea longicatena]|uniref:ABC transporter domain-containing protein n=1 Tax=Nonomuraea longicatena TaxID=83682 RepID=A0ABN1R6R8_9ACTN